MQTWIKPERRGLAEGLPAHDLAELGARIREAAVLAAALHMGQTAQHTSAGGTNAAGPARGREGGR